MASIRVDENSVPKTLVFGRVCAGAAKVGSEPTLLDAAILRNVSFPVWA